jgi:hypothetical protein
MVVSSTKRFINGQSQTISIDFAIDLRKRVPLEGYSVIGSIESRGNIMNSGLIVTKFDIGNTYYFRYPYGALFAAGMILIGNVIGQKVTELVFRLQWQNYSNILLSLATLRTWHGCTQASQS